MLTCTFEDGGKASFRHVVVNVIILKDNKILLAKRAPRFLEGNKWGLVGGFMDRDEALINTAKRETLEETGYEIKDINLFRISDDPKRRNEDRQNVVFVYLAQALEKVGKPDDESTDIKWFSFDDLPKPEKFAFDHLEHIEIYLKHLKQPFQLPIVSAF